MGTRHLIMVVSNKETKIAQYGQWDGYPRGQGVTVLTFLRSKERVKKLTDKLKHVRFETAEDEKKKQDVMDKMGCPDGWMTEDQANKYHKKFPYNSRDIGAGILEMVANSKDKEIVLVNSSDFAGDSLFCEWAYVIDLDNRKLEVYSGFNKEPLAGNERFKNIKLEEKSTYTQIRLLKIYSLDELPTKRQFISELNKIEKEVVNVD